MFKLFYMSGFDPDLLWVFFLFCFVLKYEIGLLKNCLGFVSCLLLI